MPDPKDKNADDLQTLERARQPPTHRPTPRATPEKDRETQGLVLVTGSSGFIGRALIDRLTDRYDVVGLDFTVPPVASAAFEAIRLDVTSDASVDSALDRVAAGYGRRIASIIHLAAYYDLTGEPNPKYDAVTVRGTERLLRELQAFDVEQFVFASTMLVHAPTEPGRLINEDWPLDPKLPYRRSKVRTERLIHEKRGKIPTVIVRPAGVYDDLCHSPYLAQQIADIFERKLISHVYPGDLRTGQSFLHLDDLIEALLRTVQRRRDLPDETAFLLGEPEVIGYGERQRLIGQLIHDEDWETREIAKPLAKAGAWLEDDVLDEEPFIKPYMIDIADDHHELDITRAKTLLGWQPAHTLRKTFPKMIEALKEDPPAWYRQNKLNAAKVASTRVDRDQARPVPKEAKAPTADQRQHRHDEAMRGHEAMMEADHRSTLWAHFVNIALGLWLMTSPFAFGLFDPNVALDVARDISAERNLAPPAWRNAALGWSDIISGALVVLFGALSLSRRTNWAQWANTVVGLWLLFAPLVFWTTSAAAYTNDTAVGALVIAFAILVPMMPGMSHEGMMGGPDIPPGWTYSPSTYSQRLPIIALAFLGLFISRYLTAFQLGHISTVWDPLFGQGTANIITSDVSRAWPIADAGLGAISYTLEALMGIMGDKRRWRTMPWMVLGFGFLVVPLGTVSIFFIIIQPIVIGTWCTLCLVAALAMVIMIPYSLDELIASGQFLVQVYRDRKPFWRNFFMGGAMEGGRRDEVPEFRPPIIRALAIAGGGVTYPWTLLASALLGLWLMLTRLIFGTAPPLADSDHLVGALVITVAFTAMADVARAVRFINVLFGLWLIAAPWLLVGGTLTAGIGSIVVGIALVALSLPRGRLSGEHYGSWDRYVV